MDYDLVAKMHVNELNNYLNVRGLKISGNKNELVARVISAMENNVMQEKCCWSKERFKERIWKKTTNMW